MAELVSIKRNVDVSPGQAAPAVFHCSQGDVGSKLILGLLNNGTAYSIPSGVTVTIEGSESNGSIFTPISATASGSDITFYLTGEMTAVAGPAICQAVLKSGSNILGTANFTLEVESSPMGADAPPVFTDAGWTWMLQKLTTEIVPALGDNIIDAIDSKADQSDLTALSNTVAGHAGSITALNNTVNTLNGYVTENRQNIEENSDEINDLKADLNQYFFDKRYNVYNGKLKQTGVYWNANGELISSATWGITDYISIKYGKMYYKGLTTMGTNTRAIFADINKEFISAFRPQPYLDGREVALDSIVEIPENAEYISFSLAVSQHSSFQFYFNPDEYLVNDINSISDKVTQIENNLSNNVLVGNDNMMWSWWLYPQAVSLERVRHKLYYGYVTSDGYKGVAEYDFDSQTVVKNNIIKAGVDDHNALAVYAFPSGRIVCAYSTGHNEDNKIRVRRSTSYESVAEFGEEIILESVGLTSYAQMCYSSGKLYLFYRTGTKNWAYRSSADEGATWSDETILITSSVQYYCMFRPTNTTDVLRVLMYSNPALGEDTDTNIRQAFLHTDNNTLYNSDNTTVLGTSNINKDNISILIANETGTLNRQRLFDCAITDVDKPHVLYAPFHMNNDSVYKLYDTGTVVQICGGGTDIAYTYQMGACFNGTDEIVVARGSGVDGGTDFIEKYTYNDGALGIPSVIYSEVRGNVPIRNFRPIADINGNAILWVRGYYNSATYNDYDTDVKINTLI